MSADKENHINSNHPDMSQIDLEPSEVYAIQEQADVQLTRVPLENTENIRKRCATAKGQRS